MVEPCTQSISRSIANANGDQFAILMKHLKQFAISSSNKNELQKLEEKKILLIKIGFSKPTESKI